MTYGLKASSCDPLRKKKCFASTCCQSNNKVVCNVLYYKIESMHNITYLRIQQNLDYNKWLRHTTTIGCKHYLKNVGNARPGRNDSDNNTSTERMLWEPARSTILFKFNNGSLLESTNFIKAIKISSSCKLLQKHSIVTAYFTFNAKFKLQIKGSTHYWLKGRYQTIISYRHWLE